MRTVVWGGHGAMLGRLLVLVVGMLSIQATGLRPGASGGDGVGGGGGGMAAGAEPVIDLDRRWPGRLNRR